MADSQCVNNDRILNCPHAHSSSGIDAIQLISQVLCNALLGPQKQQKYGQFKSALRHYNRITGTIFVGKRVELKR